MRSLWTGHVTFGLVSIPVGIYSAVDAAERVSFRQLHKKDKAPIRYKKYCSKEDIEVPADEIVRGYEVSKGKFAIVEKQELDEVQKEVGEGDHTIEVVQFADVGALNPLLFEKPYYLAPAKGGERAYSLFHAALVESRRVGIARFYMRTRPLLAGLMPGQDVLALAVMRAAEELKDPHGLSVPTRTPKPPELKMARNLIDQMTAEWDPMDHPNAYRTAMKKLLAAKRTFALEEEPSDADTKPAKVVDLMEALRQSLERPQHSAARKSAAKRRSAA